jgi:ketosteroid isomerase-like protein
MTAEHPNISLVKRFDPGDLAGSADLFTPDFVWRFFNSRLPDIQGDYVGASGLRDFFERLTALTEGSFQVEPVSISAFGDELVVMHNRNRMTFEGRPIEVDVVVVWRVVEGRITEVWDIPSVFSYTLPGHE